MDRLALRSAGALALATSLLLAACGGAGASRPEPAAAGRPVGAPLLLSLDAAGGALASPGGEVTLEVPPGALAGPVELSLTEITNTAPGGAGSGWRLAPADLRLLLPARLTVKPGTAVASLGLSWQASGGGFWQRQRGVTSDEATGALATGIDRLGDYAAATAVHARDLQGVVVLESTVGPAVVYTADVALDYAGEGGGTGWYVLGGTITGPASYADGADTCAVSAPEVALRPNLAELEAAAGRLSFGLSGAWPVACTGPGGDRSDTLLLAWDVAGVALHGCPRSELQPQVVAADRCTGRQRADCGAAGWVTADWTLVTCAQGSACDAGSCRIGQVSCAAPLPLCADAGPAADGSDCVEVAGGTCQAGACVAP